MNHKVCEDSRTSGAPMARQPPRSPIRPSARLPAHSEVIANASAMGSTIAGGRASDQTYGSLLGADCTVSSQTPYEATNAMRSGPRSGVTPARRDNSMSTPKFWPV